jgi:hypothetical protein
MIHLFLRRREQFAYILLSLVLIGCGRSTNTLRVLSPAWSGDSIVFKLAQIADTAQPAKAGSAEIRCLSCNIIRENFTVSINNRGHAATYIPDARNSVSVQLRINASGVDTAFRVKQPLPKDAENWYRLKQPLIGRVLTTSFALLYSDTTQETVASSLAPGDEINFFNETSAFYLVHHPAFIQPLYLLKRNAIRLE